MSSFFSNLKEENVVNLEPISKCNPNKIRDWEGLGWYEAGKRLVLVHDTPSKIDNILVAFVVDLPSNWQ